MSEAECNFHTIEGLQQILVEEWVEDLSFGRGLDFAMTSSSAFTGKLITYVIKKVLLRSATYALLATEREGIMGLVVNSLSLGWLESWYFKRLWTTRAMCSLTNTLFPQWLSSWMTIHEGPFTEEYLHNIELKTPSTVATDTFQRHLLPALVNVAYQYVVLPMVCHPGGLTEHNSIVDSIGSLIVRPVGSYVGHLLLPTKGYGAFWGGVGSYLLYCLYIQRLFIKHLEDTWDNNDTEESTNTFHGGNLNNTFYNTLSVEEDADESTIRRAYRKLAREHHPDKHAQADPEVQKRNEDKMKEVTSAYTNLADPRKRHIYDAWLEEKLNEAANQPEPRQSPSDASETSTPPEGTSTTIPSVDFSSFAKPVAAAALVFQVSLGFHFNFWSTVRAGSQGGVLLSAG